MHEPESNANRSSGKTADDGGGGGQRGGAVGPTLYSTVVQTESGLRRASQYRSERKPVANNIGIREVNFPVTKQVYDYANMVDVGLNSGEKTTARPKPREVNRARKPEPNLSDYYRPSFDRVQRIQTRGVKTVPELTVQYDGLAVSRLLNKINDLVFK